MTVQRGQEEKTIMKTESNRKPEAVEIRKLGIVNTKPVIYLYLNSEVKQVFNENAESIYQYDSKQITIPIPEALLGEIDINLTMNHSYSQTLYKEKAQKHLASVKQNLKEATTKSTQSVDRRDKITSVKQETVETIRNMVYDKV